jgi:hypothetical protein
VYIANGASSGGAILEVSFSGGVSDLDIPGLINPQGLAVDAAGNLYFSDLGAHTLGLVQNGGTVLAFAGSGAASDSADSGPAALAGIASPLGVAYDGAGNVYVADSSETAANGGLILKINGTQADMVFGSVPSGQTSSPTRVTLLNTGAGTVEITSDVLGGVNMADFTLGEECELQLPPAGSCDLSATFKPSLLGAENATLTLTAKTPGGSSSTLTVQLSGTGGAQQQAAAPTFNPPAGTYNGGQTVAMSSITPNAVIYYTTDGSTPTTSSTQYSTPIGVTASETLNALATAPGYINSTVATAAYTITYTTTGTFTFTGQPAGGGTHTLQFPQDGPQPSEARPVRRWIPLQVRRPWPCLFNLPGATTRRSRSRRTLLRQMEGPGTARTLLVKPQLHAPSRQPRRAPLLTSHSLKQGLRAPSPRGSMPAPGDWRKLKARPLALLAARLLCFSLVWYGASAESSRPALSSACSQSWFRPASCSRAATHPSRVSRLRRHPQ